MSEAADYRDPEWVHRSVLHAVASWILVVAVAFSFHTVWVFTKEQQRPERDIRTVRESGVQRIYHRGRVQSQTEIVAWLERRPYWAALPFLALALLMGACAWFAFRHPVGAAAAALFIAVLGGLAYLTRKGWWDPYFSGFFVVQWILLGLGIRSAVGYARAQARKSDPGDPSPDTSAPR